MKRLKYIGPYLIVLAALLWGLDGILRRSLFSLPPIIIVFYEHLIGALILLPFLFKKVKFTKKEWGAILIVSLLSGVLGTLWFTTALVKVNYISFSVVFLLQKLQPIFATIFAIIFLKEKINARYARWAILAIVAAYFVTFQNGIVNFSTGQGTVIAALFALGAAFAWGSSTAFSRFALLRHSNTVITAWRFFLTTIMALVFVFILGSHPQLTSPSTNQFLRLLAIALSTGMVALWIYYRGLKQTQVKIATILELTFPLVAVIVDIFLYNNVLSVTQYIAAAVLLFTMFKVSRLNVGIDKVYSAKVKSGAGRGRRIGFPTLNFVIPDKFEQAYGIYCGYVYIDDQKYKTVFHYGPIPTFSEKEKSLEAYLLDTELEQEPKQVNFKFKARLRDIEKFSNKDNLAINIEVDIQRARKILK